MASPNVEGRVLVGIFTPAFSYPASLSHQATISAALTDLGLQEDECEFLKPEHDKLACVIKNNKFTLQYVEDTYAHNKALLEQLQRAAEALVAFRTKVEEDSILINELREQLNAEEIKYEEEHSLRKILQDKLEKLKLVVNSVPVPVSEHVEPSKPKIPKLQLTAMNGMHSEPILSRTANKDITVTTSPRAFVREAYVQDANTQTVRYGSPREQAPPVNMNGGTSGLDSPHGNGKHSDSPRSTQSPRSGISSPGSPHGSSAPLSPRLSSSPRGGHSSSSSPRSHSNLHTSSTTVIPAGGVQQVKEHLRRHSTNFGEDGIVRRHSSIDAPISRPSPRSKSSSEIPPHYFDLTQPFPDVHSMMPVVHSFTYANPADQIAAKREARKTIASPMSASKLQAEIRANPPRSDSQLDFSSDTLLSQRKLRANRKMERMISLPCKLTANNPTITASCRLCSCDKFRVTGKAEWMCTCGHANIKHAVFLKASPAPSPTVSPRKVV